MIDFTKREIVKFSDLAKIERSRKDTEYQAGTILIQVSATKGQLVYLDKPQKVDSKYAVILPYDNIYAKYLYEVSLDVIPDFLRTYQTGLNIKPEIFQYLKLDIHTDKETQIYIANVLGSISDKIEEETKVFESLKQVKNYFLDNLFV